MNIFSASKMPSKKTIAFFGTALSILGLLKYDQYKQQLIAENYISEVQKYANEPLEIDQIPTRICVYILPSFDDTTTFRSEKFVKSFILPILNSSGMDIRIANADTKEQLMNMIKSNMGPQKVVPPFNYAWYYSRHVGVGLDAVALLTEAQDQYKKDFDFKLEEYQKEYTEKKSKAWFFTPPYEPPVFIEPKIELLPLNVTKGFKQFHKTIFSMFTRSYEIEATGAQVVSLIKRIAEDVDL